LRISLAVIGQMKSGPERELADRYLDRFGKVAPSVGLEFRGVRETGESRARDAQTRKREEARNLIGTDAENARILSFDERGKPLTSAEFAALIGRWRDDGAKTMLALIGGADGLDESLRERADRIVSFGAMTLPHQLVRVLAAEQLYRAATILSGHPYHRE
jgi:23S rRNA (pseudouridine1915-N3)-methyltransferase